jgi:pimeloyl-ACP methyl ester carboxylesterase
LQTFPPDGRRDQSVPPRCRRAGLYCSHVAEAKLRHAVLAWLHGCSNDERGSPISTLFRVRWLRLPVLAAMAAVLAFGALAASSTSARPRAAGVKPTVVLVHGAWAGASSWDRVISRLQADGYAVVAPANPLRSLTGDATYIASVLKSIKGPIVLAGHSYGGAVITDAATGNSNVRALVYIDAFVPDQGETVLQLAAKNPGSELPAAITEVPYAQGGTKTGADVYIKTASFRSVFAADVPAGTADLMAATQRPIAWPQ